MMLASPVVRRVLSLTLLASSALAHAETPAFDRPGIAFSTTTLPAGGVSIEQGLPDIEHDRADGSESTLYSAGTLLRLGLSQNTELQFGVALLNHLLVKAEGDSASTTGIGDSSLGLKIALPSAFDSFSWAALGSVAFETGDDAFTAGATQYSLGVTGNWDLSETLAFALYANVDRLRGDNTSTFSPSLSFAINDRVSAYVEAAVSTVDGEDDYLGGGGLTWMLKPNLQLDLYADAGLTSDSTDLLAGFGISIYFE